MGEFAEAVRLSKIVSPVQKKFMVEEWENNYNSYSNPDDADQKLYITGIWFNKKLSIAREEWEKLKLSNYCPEALIISQCALVNRNSVVIEQTIRESLENKVLASSIINFKIETIAGSGFSFDAEGLIQGALDSLRFTLTNAIKSTGNIYPFDKNEFDAFFNRTLKAINIGVLYHWLEDLWNQCCWNGRYINVRNDYEIILHKDTSASAIDAISTFRYYSLLHEIALRTMAYWRTIKDSIKRSFCSTLRRAELIIVNQQLQIKVKPLYYDAITAPKPIIDRITFQELYFEELINTEFPNHKNITLDILIRAWGFLDSLADQFKEHYPSDTSIKTMSDLEAFCPKISKTIIAQTLSDALEVPTATAESIMIIFTFSGSTRDEVFAKPFISLNNEEIVFMVACVKASNLLRAMETWMKMGGIDLSTRGPLYEASLIKQISRAISKSNLLKNAGIHPSNLVVEASDALLTEEVDIIFWVGNTVFICEAKCNILPTNPIEHHNYYNDLRQAADQIKRKKSFITKNITNFLEKINHPGKDNPDCIQISPLILSNLPIGVGVPIDGVPITDIVILGRYLNEGHMLLLRDAEENSLVGIDPKIVFYTTEEEAEKRIVNYLLAPPQIRIIIPFLKSNDYPLLNFSENEITSFSQEFEIDAPNDLEFYLDVFKESGFI